MEFDDLIEKIFKEVADLLDYKFGKTRGGYLLSNKTESFGFITFVTRQGKLKITMNQKELNKPIDLGDYTKEDLKSKAKKAIIVKLTEGITRH